jgi:hypothetical protein
MSTCARQCWIFAAAMGVLVLVLVGPGVGWGAGLFLGLLTVGLLGPLMVVLFCQGAEDVEEWPRAVDNAKDPDVQGARSIRRDDGPVAHAPIARPQRPQGMEGAPQGASADAVQAVTFTAPADGMPAASAPSKPATDAGRAVKPRRGKAKAAPLAEAPETAHSGSVGQGEST